MAHDWKMKRKPLVKICGITNFDDGFYSAQKGAHFLGFIFCNKSPRNISPDSAEYIIKKIKLEMDSPPFFTGVFVNEEIPVITGIIKKCSINFVQLHGNEDLQYTKDLRKAIVEDIKIIKAFRADDSNSLNEMYNFNSDFVLADSYKDGHFGGTGETFNWDLLKKFNLMDRLFLAGGLNPDNIIEAMNSLTPYSFDLSSGLEKEPGLKDRLKIDLFFKNYNS
jgi:phosphoribosylanthranilate isomerase